MDKKAFIQKAALMQPSYQASETVKQKLAQVDLVAAVGPTGVGKTSLMYHSGMPCVISDTTRDPRKGETDGTDFNFRKDYDVLSAELERGEFVQYVVLPNGEFYGTKVTSYSTNGPCTMAVAASTIDHFFFLGFKSLIPIYIIPPDYETWMNRIHGLRDKDIPARLVEAKSSLESALGDSRYHFLINDDLILACDMFKSFGRHMVDDAAAQSHAREVALRLLTGIQTSDLNPVRPEGLL